MNRFTGLWFLVVLLAVVPFPGPGLRAQETSDPTTPRERVDPVELEYEALLAADDAAQAEVDQWIQEAGARKSEDQPLAGATLELRVRQRLDKVRDSYEDFIRRHPKHAQAVVAYGSFLHDIGDELAAKQQWEKALELDPGLPAAWNNLANYFGHRGPVKKAFEYYEKAIELAPEESLYYHNMGTTVYLFRKDAREYYGITEQEVFDKALALYDQAMERDPENFLLASDIAQTFYGIKPLRLEDAFAAWQRAFELARDDIERQGVHIHFARLHISAGRFDQARAQLEKVSHPMYQTLRERLERNIRQKEADSEEGDDSSDQQPADNPPPAGKSGADN